MMLQCYEFTAACKCVCVWREGEIKVLHPAAACEAGRAARRGWVAERNPITFYVSPPPSTHTHLFSTAQSRVLPRRVRGYRSRRFHVQSLRARVSQRS